ncbi:MAG: hypothetical protein ABI627_10475 [Polyangiaceae bacterium]
MRIGVALLGVGLMAVGCAGEASKRGAEQGANPNGSAGKPGAASASSSECTWPASLNDAGLGACGVGRAYVNCTGPSGGCLCLSDDPTTCAACAEQFQGPLTCVSECAANEYAVSCGGPPQPGSGFVYQDVPAACHSVAATPGGSQYACCPCQ